MGKNVKIVLDIQAHFEGKNTFFGRKVNKVPCIIGWRIVIFFYLPQKIMRNAWQFWIFFNNSKGWAWEQRVYLKKWRHKTKHNHVDFVLTQKIVKICHMLERGHFPTTFPQIIQKWCKNIWYLGYRTESFSSKCSFNIDWNFRALLLEMGLYWYISFEQWQ